MITLPDELILEIVYAAHTDDFGGSQVLCSLSLVCKHISRILDHNRTIIDARYTVKHVDPNRTTYTFGGLFHNRNGPAIVDSGGSQYWYRRGKLHRDGDLPAIVTESGVMEWYHKGQHHRGNDLPATISPNGSRLWYQRGRLHREGDMPAIVSPYDNGT